MKETGIIMSGNHPKLILDGLKTMTRRVIKLTRKNEWLLDPDVGWSDEYIKDPDNELVLACPYGGVGDGLWVRETWASENRYNHLKPSEIPQTAKIFYLADSYSPFEMGKVRSSLFMPRWASRILLEITEVRAERLQEISHDDCLREGIVPQIPDWPFKDIADYVAYVKDQYRILWDSLNAKRGYGWDKNSWVWPIEFGMTKQ